MHKLLLPDCQPFDPDAIAEDMGAVDKPVASPPPREIMSAKDLRHEHFHEVMEAKRNCCQARWMYLKNTVG